MSSSRYKSFPAEDNDEEEGKKAEVLCMCL